MNEVDRAVQLQQRAMRARTPAERKRLHRQANRLMEIARLFPKSGRSELRRAFEELAAEHPMLMGTPGVRRATWPPERTNRGGAV